MTGTFVVSGAGGIGANTENRELSLSPNPFQDKLTILRPAGRNKLLSLEIFDAAGKMVQTMDFDPPVASMSRTVELNNLPRGLFLFRFTDDAGEVIVRRATHN